MRRRGRPKKSKNERKVNTGFTLTPLARRLLKRHVAKGQWAKWVSTMIEKKLGLKEAA